MDTQETQATMGTWHRTKANNNKHGTLNVKTPNMTTQKTKKKGRKWCSTSDVGRELLSFTNLLLEFIPNFFFSDQAT